MGLSISVAHCGCFRQGLSTLSLYCAVGGICRLVSNKENDSIAAVDSLEIKKKKSKDRKAVTALYTVGFPYISI